MSATDPNAAAFREQIDKRFRFLLDELEPDEMRSFVRQAKAELGDGTVIDDKEALRKLEKFDHIMAPYLLRAIGKVVERLEENLNNSALL
jgi:hypothetical protein